MDSLKNGTILGALAGVAIAGGTYIVEFLKGIVPADWYFFGAISLYVYLGLIGAVVGYFIDKY